MADKPMWPKTCPGCGKNIDGHSYLSASGVIYHDYDCRDRSRSVADVLADRLYMVKSAESNLAHFRQRLADWRKSHPEL